MINIIFATDDQLNFCRLDHIGLPWNKHSEDMNFFKQTTIGNNNNAIIMGKKTFDSFCHQPLSNRTNIVLTKSFEPQILDNNVRFENTLDSAILYAKQLKCDDIFIIGGINIIQEALTNYSNIIDKIYITTIISNYQNYPKCHKFIYNIPSCFKKQYTKSIAEDAYVTTYIHEKYRQLAFNKGEDNYLDLVKDVLNNGEDRDDRTGVGTLSLFGKHFTIDISNNNFPLLTTKKVFWKGIMEELLFFISGKTDTKLLEEKGVNIWKGNTSREFLDKRGLYTLKEGEYGKSYGYQWRNFGDKIDQLQELIDGIKNDPYSRRHYMTAWNPLELNNIPLPACHLSCQFYVSPKSNELSCQVYMRSCDIFLGLPFNIGSYALLTYMIAHLTKLKPKSLSFCLGDAHIYKNHIDQCKELLTRSPYNFPSLFIKRNVDNIDDFKADDFILTGYNSHSAIKAQMAV